MKTVGQFVEEAVDLTGRGLYREAVAPTCAAIGATARKAFEKETLSEMDYKKFLKENWELIAFMGMRRALPLPLNIPFGLKRIVPTFNVHHGAEEITLMVIRETLRLGKMPGQFDFNSAGVFEVKDNKLLLPSALVCGLLGSVIFHPVNKDENISDKYWISISDFKMFISELWGKRDLAERIMKFYLE